MNIIEELQKMNEIRDWTRSRGLTKKFRSEIIKHFEYSFARVTISDEADILSHLPHQLRLRVVLAGSMHRGIADGIEKSIRGLKDDSFSRSTGPFRSSKNSADFASKKMRQGASVTMGSE